MLGQAQRSTIAVLILLSLLAPAASAAHWTLYHAGIDDSPASTGEDDLRVLVASGNPLDGQTNRVVGPARVPGDGGLFLDARLTNRAPAGDFDVSLASAAASLSAEPVILPGALSASAWFGDWRDVNEDDRIDDVHDAACATPCPTDEFIWHGLGTGATLGMVTFLVPYWGTYMVHASGSSASYSRFPMEDHTARDAPAQGWSTQTDIGHDRQSLDAGFLATVQTLTVAGARPTTTALGYALDDPDGRYDVDRYASLSPDVEALYVGAARDLRGLETGGAGEVLSRVQELNGVVFGNVQFVFDEFTAVAATVSRIRENVSMPDSRFYEAPAGKEPTTSEDDFEHRAEFGGVGDVAGSFNSYAGYADGFHFYFDAVARTLLCTGASVSSDQGVARSTDNCVATGGTASELDPRGGSANGRRSAGVALGFEGNPVLWHDLNGDTYLGARCDPTDAEAFDAERRTCTGGSGYWPHSLGSPEVRGICEASSVRNERVRLTPMGADWSGVVLVKDHRDVARTQSSVTVLTGGGTVELRWRDACEIGNARVFTRDVLYLPAGGASFPIRVESSAKVASFEDVDAGVQVTDEGVRDVDVLPASM